MHHSFVFRETALNSVLGSSLVCETVSVSDKSENWIASKFSEF